MSNILLMQIVYYGSYVFAFLLVWKFVGKLRRWKLLGMFFRWVLVFLFVWARFIEPQKVVVQETRLDVWFEKNIVLISDLHLGIYKSSNYLQKVVNRINDIEDIDAVLIAWDFTNTPKDTSTKALTTLFAPLADIQVPVYAVLGNHDVEVPWSDLRLELISALNINKVNFLHNDIVKLDQTYIVWLGPHLAGEDEIEILDGFDSSDDVIVLTHNPDTIIWYAQQDIADVTLVGHTHCGQVRFERFPALYKRAIPTVGDFDCGIYNDVYTTLYISPGVWEVMLPVRFMNPPTIDVLLLR